MDCLALFILVAIVITLIFLISRARKHAAEKKIERECREQLDGLQAKIEPYLKSLETTLNTQSDYLMKKDWDTKLAISQTTYREVIATLNKLQTDNKEYSSLKRFCELHANTDIRVQQNEKYKQKELNKYKMLLDDVGGHSLDEQQRNAVVTDEYNNLIIAGAGSGKSLTVVGKVKYLVQSKGIKPENILVTSFTRASVSDLSKKISNAGIEGISTKTFHKIGLEILGEVAVANENALSLCIEKYLSETLPKDNLQAAAFIEFFGMRQLVEYSQRAKESAEEHMANLKASDLYTLKGMVSSSKDELDTFNGERVKSVEELLIANFLFLNGIEYEYEKTYTEEIPEALKDQNRRAYQPDFYLIDYDIWLEHFGINASGRPEWIKNEIEQQKYVDDMDWKRKVHKQCKTKLLESYSYWNEDQDLLNKVRDLLMQNGINPNPDPEKNAEYCKELLTNRAFCESTGKLLGTFISLAKSNNEEAAEIEDRARATYQGNGSMWHRFELFMTFARPIMEEYRNYLRSNNQVDFDDMINLAAKKVREEGLSANYKYIIIDEYQDISKSRLGLVLAIREKTDAKLVCIGDDWQSIYRFAGSDVTLFTKFESLVGYHEKLRIEHTYRNSQQLVDVASRFVLKNRDQIPKKMVALSEKAINAPISIVALADKQAAFIFALNNILNQSKPEETITVLARNKNDIYKLFPRDIPCKNVRIASSKKQYDKASTADATIYFRHGDDSREIAIDYKTVHKSKGLEADNVIVINLENNSYGFPNMIEDDPILNLLLADSDNFLFSEERRLFYVALTRTKNNVWLLTPKEMDYQGQSRFIIELRKESNSAVSYYDEKTNDASAKCPKCGGSLIMKTNETTKTQFVGCSNFPFCNKTYSDIRIIEDNIVCPKCGGHLARRINKETGEEFFGCTNYPSYCYFMCNLKDIDDLKDGKLPPIRDSKGAPQVTNTTSADHHRFANRSNQQKSSQRHPVCKKCGAAMVVRTGKRGKFYGCSNFPACNNTIDFNKDADEQVTYHSIDLPEHSENNKEQKVPNCPVCGRTMVVRQGPYGNFYGCQSYPRCKGKVAIE